MRMILTQYAMRGNRIDRGPALLWVPLNKGLENQREYSSKPLKHSIVKRILVVKR